MARRRRQGAAKERGGLYHQDDRGDVKAIAVGCDAYEAAGSQGCRMTEERWWKSFGCTAPSVGIHSLGNFHYF
jgi:hypothetical protein